MDWIFDEFKNDTGIDLTKQPDAVQRIKEEAEKAKIALSSTQEYEINLPFITADATGPKHIQKKLTRSKLEQLTDDLFERTVPPVKACLKDAKIAERKEIDELVLVGGMTRMPKVVETARNLVGKEPHKGVNPDEVVAIGAAIQGGVLKGDVKDVLLLDVTPLTLGDRNRGRRGHADDSAQHDDPDAQVADLFHLQRQPARRGNRGAARRAPDVARQQKTRHIPSRRHSAGAARRSADRSHLRHRCQRHPARLGEGSRHRQGAEDLDHRQLRPRRKKSRRCSAKPKRTPRKTRRRRKRSRSRTTPTTSPINARSS